MAKTLEIPLNSAWSGPAEASFDFRSDVITRPTTQMLEAIAKTTLFDDVYVEDTTTNDLEAHIADLTEQPAALFVLSGTMGNQLALRSHLTQPPYAVLADSRSHILNWEAGGLGMISGAMMKGVIPSNGRYLTLDDIRPNVTLGNNVHVSPTRVICLENTLGGTIMPLAEVQAISTFAREHNIKLHLDGARLWEAVAAGAASLTDYTKCFDSVSLCFSKGLGAPVGSILVGQKSFIEHARWIRKAIGGGLRQPGVVTAAARIAVDVTFGKGPNGEGGLLKQSHLQAKKIANIWCELGGKLEKPTETNMVWLDLASISATSEQFISEGKAKGLRISGARLVVHYQISDHAVERLTEVLKIVSQK